MGMDCNAAIPAKKGEEAFSPIASIVVLAYNHLEYTRQCIESITRYTSHIEYELITINNGSTDGTEEYFNSLPHAKKISFRDNIGVCRAINHGFRIAEGKYTLNISNDIVVTTRWLDNLLICMESDGKIGMAVPVCNASCNYQQINPPCKTMEEIQRFAAQYNVSNPCMWEERLKLSTYAGIYRTELQKALGGFDEDFNPGCYDDDAICFSMRRMGYKVIFAKDTFVHHYGARSFNEEYEKDRGLMIRNKRTFMGKFGVDPYIAGLIDFCVLDLLSYDGAEAVGILGVGRSCGTTVLHLKNACRLHGSKNIGLYYASEQEGNLPDLKTVCDGCFRGGVRDISARFGPTKYNYIVLESESRGMEDRQGTLSLLYGLLKAGGQMVCTAATPEILAETNGIFQSLGARPVKQINNYYLCFSRPGE